MFLCKQVLCLEKEVTSSQPSSVRVRRTSQNNTYVSPQSQTATSTSNSTVIQPSHNPVCTPPPDTPQGKRGSDGSPVRLAEVGRSVSSLVISSSHKHQTHRDSTPSLASDISLPCATMELQHRLQQLQKWVCVRVIWHTDSLYAEVMFAVCFFSCQCNYILLEVTLPFSVVYEKHQKPNKWVATAVPSSLRTIHLHGPMNNTVWLTG